MKRQYELIVTLKDQNKDVFAKTYKIEMWEDFVNDKMLKHQNFTNHVRGLVRQLIRNSKPAKKFEGKKREIYVVNFGY